ncbi:MAG: aminotransferase class I/II-fold pyridoxal phosphate-dependent enzyme [Candidatus Heimdallarchaeota archaeon]|nr:aminotransferase class I/II-fold pyridoxal phosphate-dependent enzyme [Candidatus Heimdallarchaeota archaeon]MCG3253170.1 aminotransferase class I/II-fold pyridoxal phosphate-dependent enzyme [Candidatus Heimdallarchaeota archaeon]MCK4290307.1 aminotransferase class I/II-fold pyridoxal phosphate-dependent enzyme [Candidatus Heimdallarchaeota archaeon]
MKVDPFLVEHFMNKYEHHVELNLAETCVNPFTLEEFLSLMDREDFFEEFKKKQLTYGYIEGSPELRKGIANQYKTMKEDNILVCGGAIGANFITFYSLVEPGDNVVSILPTYQQLYSTARSFGANVKLLKLKWEDQWLPDLRELMKLVDDKTKLIVMNNPHNPTGSLIDESLLKRICQIAENAGAYLLCDETYHGLFYEEKDRVPSAVDIYDKAIATGSFSKGISLTGLRLGWIAASKQIIKECMDHRDYTTISNGMIDDALAAIAMKNLDRIYERNMKLLRTNLEILTNWIENEPLIDWIPPSAASVGFLKQHTKISSEKLCVKLINEKNTFLVPGECFEMEGYIRIGFGNKTEVLKEGLARFKEFLEQFR